MSWKFGINLFLIGVIGVSASWWLLYYTDLFPVIGGWLSLGGLFSWLAFVSKVLPESKLKGLQDFFDRWIFDSWPTLIAVPILGVIAFAYGNSRGTIQVESLRETSDRSVSIERWNEQEGSAKRAPAEASRVEPQRLPPGGRVRSVHRTSSNGPGTFRVKVGGYPDKLVTLKPWERLPLYVPSSLFDRPVVLLRPTSAVLDGTLNAGMTLFVSIDGTEFSRPFDGHAVWVGCDEDVEVPQAWMDLFRAELARDEREAYTPYLIYPQALTDDRVVLADGARIIASVGMSNKPRDRYAAVEFTVAESQGRRNFPQVKELRKVGQ